MTSKQEYDEHAGVNAPGDRNREIIVGAIQPGYLPWLGVFEQIWNSDIFILYDDLQYTRHSWQNRNLIKSASGRQWLIVPVCQQFGQTINRTRIDNSQNWARRHWKTIEGCYGKADYFDQYKSFFKDIYSSRWEYISDLNITIIKYIVSELSIRTPIVVSSELGFEDNFEYHEPSNRRRNERIVHFMQHLGGTVLFNGALGQRYIDREYLSDNGIKIRFQNYRHPIYTQRFGKFIDYLSIVDLLFNHGPHSLDILVTTDLRNGADAEEPQKNRLTRTE